MNDTPPVFVANDRVRRIVVLFNLLNWVDKEVEKEFFLSRFFPFSYYHAQTELLREWDKLMGGRGCVTLLDYVFDAVNRVLLPDQNKNKSAAPLKAAKAETTQRRTSSQAQARRPTARPRGGINPAPAPA